MTKLKAMAVRLLLIGAGAYSSTTVVAQSDQGRRIKLEGGKRAVSAVSKAQPPRRLMSEYVVEPPDLVLVEVLEALPARPISGERLVRPDGKISLGFYGEVYVAGLTLTEIKIKIISQLQRFMQDWALGLVATNEDGEILVDPGTGEPKRIDPKESARVFVDVSACNSKIYYMEGEVFAPGRLPVTGQERILDAISLTGGLTPEADHEQAFLYREGAKGEPVQALKIEIDQIMLGDDLSTNYPILPGDRLVVRRRMSALRENQAASAPRSGAVSRPASNNPSLYFKRPGVVVDSLKQQTGEGESPDAQLLEKRITEMEPKLDLILETLKRPAH